MGPQERAELPKWLRAACENGHGHGKLPADCLNQQAAQAIEDLLSEVELKTYHLGSKQAFLDQHHIDVDADRCDKCGDRETKSYPSNLGEFYDAVQFLDAMCVPADIGDFAARVAWMVDKDSWGEGGVVMAAQEAVKTAEAQRHELVKVARAAKNMPVAVEERCILCERSYPAHDSDCPVAAFGQALASLSPATAALLEDPDGQ